MIGEHTLLINMVIGLCNGQKGWPSLMHDHGYEVRSLERVLTTRDGEKAKPDVVIVSNRNKHVILAECKSGSEISPRQDRKYDGLETRSIVDDIRAGRFIDRHVVVYAISGASLRRIGGQTRRPLVVFSPSRIWGRGDFGVRQLSEKLRKGVPLGGMSAPTRYYPFGLDDSDLVVIFHIMRGVVKLAIKKKVVIDLKDRDSPDLLFDAIYELQDILPSRHVKELKNRIRQTAEKMAFNRRLVRHMDEARRRADPKARGRLVEFCMAYLNGGAAQKSLQDFTQPGEARA